MKTQPTAATSLLLLGLAALSSCAATLRPVDESEAIPAHAARQLNVGFLIVDGVYNTELMAPFDIFHHSVFHTEPGMRVFTVAPTMETVTSFEGIRIEPDFSYETAPPIDVLVVPSAEDSMGADLEDEAMIDWVRMTGTRAEYVVSLCDGAFVLAQAGLLEGRRATTFPSDIALFRAKFQKVEVEEALSFVHDGPAITSVGGAKSYDAALYLCEVLYGAKVARGIAGGLVIDWKLSGVDHLVVPSN